MRTQQTRLHLESLETRLVPSFFYVSPTGKDSNTGTSQAPWLTLQHAADQVKAGDTVTVEAGTYAGFVVGWDTADPGTATAPITFQAQPGAVINHRDNQTADGIDLEPGDDYWVIDGFTVQNDGTISRAGIRVTGSTNDIVRNNNVDGMGTWGIFTGFAQNVLIEDNVASNSQTQHGIYVSNSADNPVIRGNITFGNFACGIQINADLSQGGDGIITGALVEDNVIHDNGAGGGSAINWDGVQNSIIQNNLLYNNHSSGISLFKIDGAAGSKNNIVVNNTIIMAADARWALNIQNASTGNTVYNNILYDYNSAHGSISIAKNSLLGFTSDYNVVMQAFTVNGGNSVMKLKRWQSLTGQDLHSIVATPAALFVNAAANDYHLSATSPAIDKGTSTDAPTVDLDGNPRPYGAGWDMGCYEYVGTTPAPAGLAAVWQDRKKLDGFFARQDWDL